MALRVGVAHFIQKFRAKINISVKCKLIPLSDDKNYLYKV